MRLFLLRVPGATVQTSTAEHRICKGKGSYTHILSYHFIITKDTKIHPNPYSLDCIDRDHRKYKHAVMDFEDKED